MRVLRTQIGLVMICVAAPASKEAAKKSVGERWDFICACVSVVDTCWVVVLGVDVPGGNGEEGEGGDGALR